MDMVLCLDLLTLRKMFQPYALNFDQDWNPRTYGSKWQEEKKNQNKEIFSRWPSAVPA